MSERLPPICTTEEIKSAYHAGLRIVWEENGVRDVWEVLEVDDTSAVTRFILPDGTETDIAADFEALSAHSAFPTDATVTAETFETPMGSMSGTHVVVGGDRHFYFADDYPGPPMIISGPESTRRQVQRSDR